MEMQLDIIIRKVDDFARVLVFIYNDDENGVGGDFLQGYILAFKLLGTRDNGPSYHYVGVDKHSFQITHRVADSQTVSEQSRMVYLNEITLGHYDGLLSHLFRSRTVYNLSRQGWLRGVLSDMIRFKYLSRDQLNSATQIPTRVCNGHSPGTESQ